MANIQITLEAARVNAGYTLDDAAKELGKSKATLISWEKGRTEPSYSQLSEMCGLYKMPVECILLPK